MRERFLDKSINEKLVFTAILAAAVGMLQAQQPSTTKTTTVKDSTTAGSSKGKKTKTVHHETHKKDSTAKK